MRRDDALAKKYPPSPACACDVCVAYCARPGWWTVRGAARAMEAGHGDRMMLEVSPDRAMGVLSPSFRGCEGGFALQDHASAGCTFLREGRCELHRTGHQPLECRFCHHDRPGQGPICHHDLEKDWKTPAGRELVARWCERRGLLAILGRYGLEGIVPAKALAKT